MELLHRVLPRASARLQQKDCENRVHIGHPLKPAFLPARLNTQNQESWTLNQQVINRLLSSTESQGHEKILDIAGLQPGSAKSDVRCSPCAPKVIHDLDAVMVVLYRGLGSPFNALKVRPHKKLSPPRHFNFGEVEI